MKKSAVIFLHAGYWIMYLLLMILFVLVMSQTNGKPLGLMALLRTVFLPPIFFVAILPGLIGFYVSYFVLFFKFLKTKRIIALVASLLMISVLVGYLLLMILLYFSMASLDASLSQFAAMAGFLSFVTLINAILGLVMKGFIEFYKDIKIKEELNKKNFEIELALVKSQINPHFLFNTINNIDALIQLDADKASQYLNQLSDIMRFMLYETKTEKIPLDKELAYIEKYIALQRIRTSNPYYIKYSIEGNSQFWQVEPMLFIPIIENAFKHAEHLKGEEVIGIHFKVDERQLVFICENAYDAKRITDQNSGGLGKDLIKRRLALLFNDQHEFAVSLIEGRYRVQLTLNSNS